MSLMEKERPPGRSRRRFTKEFKADDVAILNITHAEALIYPSRLGKLGQTKAVLDQLGFYIEELNNGTADRTRDLQAGYGNRNFPMVDAVVVALGIERSWTVTTYNTKWPEIPEAEIEISEIL